MQYKQQREQQSPNSASNGAPPAAEGLQEALAALQSPAPQVPAAAAAAAAALQAALPAQPEVARSLPKVGPHVPARVRTAMQAAMEYRAKKATATKAAADAAAAAAEAGWHDRQLSPARAAAVAQPSAPNQASSVVPARGATAVPAGRKAPNVLPEVVRAQAAAHKAMVEAQAAEAQVRKALELPAGPGPDSEYEDLHVPAEPVAAA